MAAIEYMTKEEVKKKRERKQVIVDREMEKIYKKFGGIEPKKILELAEDSKHPLHRYFEWDDTKAAKQYRLEQAYKLMMSSKFVVQLVEQSAQGPKVVTSAEVRKFVSTFRGEPFKLRKEALKNTDERKVIIERKVGELRAWCKAVLDLEELQELRGAILEALNGFAL